MPHFGSGSWVSNYGLIPYAQPTGANPAGYLGSMTKLGANTISAAAGTNFGATEGNNLATWTVPDAGLYRVSCYFVITVLSNAATTNVFTMVVTFTDAQGLHTQANVQPSAPSFDISTVGGGAVGNVYQSVGVVRALAAGTIVVATKSVQVGVGATIALGNLTVIVEKVSD